MDLYNENLLLIQENARLHKEVTDLKEKLQQILSLSLSISDSINDNSNSNSNSNNNSNKRVKISNDNGYNDVIDITSSNNNKVTSSNNTANSNINSTTSSSSSSSSSSIRTHLSKIPPYNPNIEINWLLQFDGGSRGNPGPAGAGAVLYQTGIVILTMLPIIKLILTSLRSSDTK